MMTKRTWIALSGLALAGALHAGAESGLTAEETAAGWTLLSGGDSLKHWRGYSNEMAGEGWRASDGVISLQGKGGDLVTKEEFGDFELSLEWRVTSGANSGVIYRVGLGERATHFTGPEYQVLDNLKAKDNKLHNHLAGSLYDLILGANAQVKAVGEWNTARIVVRGWQVEHWLNGEKVVDVDLAGPAGKALIEASKFKDWKKFATLRRGHIALQDHGDAVSYRAIKVRELK